MPSVLGRMMIAWGLMLHWIWRRGTEHREARQRPPLLLHTGLTSMSRAKALAQLPGGKYSNSTTLWRSHVMSDVSAPSLFNIEPLGGKWVKSVEP